MPEFYINRTEPTYMTDEISAALGEGKVYAARDVLNPAAMAHLIKHLVVKEIGCICSDWTRLYPSRAMLEQFFRSCRARGIRIHFIDLNSPRDDVRISLQANEDLIASAAGAAYIVSLVGGNK